MAKRPTPAQAAVIHLYAGALVAPFRPDRRIVRICQQARWIEPTGSRVPGGEYDATDAGVIASGLCEVCRGRRTTLDPNDRGRQVVCPKCDGTGQG